MSVSVYSVEEMRVIHGALRLRLLGGRLSVPAMDCNGLQPDPTTPEERLAWALECAWIAQEAAHYRTYGERVTLAEGLDDTTPLNMTLDDRELASRIGNVLYNCRSNGGTDFCPAGARAKLESFRLQLLERFAEECSRSVRS